ncbi:MAG: response regulator transcription factor [Bacillota bacterium]
MEKIRILVADDEPKMRQLVRIYLEKEGYTIDEAVDGRQALEVVNANSYHLIILDLMLPAVDGWTVCREVRKKLDIPIIMLTARGEESDRVLGFELGADDYVVKPFSPRELVARVKALLRRTVNSEDKQLITFPDMVIDHEARRVKVQGEEVIFTPKEYDLLFFLAAHPGKVYTREKILELVWGYDFFGDLRTVDTHIKKLREKLSRKTGSQKFIHTVWGVGYKFEVVS